MNELFPYIVDAGVIFILVLYLAKGWKKGLARTLVTMLSFVIAILLTWHLYGYVADFLRMIGFQERIAALFGAGNQAPTQPGITEAASYIESLFLPEALKNSMIGNNNYEAYAALGVDTFRDYVGVFLANIVVNAVALLIVFVGAFILLKIFGRSLSIVNHIPLIGLANRLLGMIANGIIGYFVIQLLMFVFTMMATGQNLFTGIIQAVENSTVAVWFYQTNYLVEWIMKIFA